MKSCRKNRFGRSFILTLVFLVGGVLLWSEKRAVVGRRAQKQFLPSRDRVVRARHERGTYGRFRDNGKPIEGPNYHKMKIEGGVDTSKSFGTIDYAHKDIKTSANSEKDPLLVPRILANNSSTTHRQLAKNKKCCGNYVSYSASDMCSLYNQDCESGKTKSHDDGDSSCSQEGLAFIGISFSVSSKNGNPYSYQLCDQFPMENLIDRNYDYIMSMDEDGWLVGGGYKQFDYSGKMPYIDSSHTELLRIGSMDVSKGGTSIQQVYNAMSNLTFEPFPVYPEYLKGGGGHRKEKEGEGERGKEGEGDKGEGRDEHRRRVNQDNGNANSVPSGDITLIVSVVEVYNDNSTYSTYQTFLNDLFASLQNVNEGSCVDDHDTDPHVSMARGVKFKSSYHMQQYMFAANKEVAVWQAMYPYGVVIGSSSYAAFPPGSKNRKKYVGYGNLYFFFDRMNITKAFAPSRSLTSNETYYATLYKKVGAGNFYDQVNSSDVYSLMNGGEGGGDDGDSWQYNPYKWKSNKALHDQTVGWDLTPNCYQEGEAFLGIPLSRKSKSSLQSTSTFQQQFNFERILDRNFSYVLSFGTNHGWLVGGEQTGNGAGSLVDKDTAHIPLFYLGTTNPNMGGMSLSDMVKILKTVQFGTLYIKPAFVFVDNNGHLKLQFEADSYSSLGYLYNSLCEMLGVKWNYVSPKNSYGIYTNCAMHAAGDRAKYGCGPYNANSGGFCPQMTIAYGPKFKSQDAAAAYISQANNYVDYWRSLYPYGVAVGTDDFCNAYTSSGQRGGCLGLFLNRMDLYYVFEPELTGSWEELDESDLTPTVSPAPTSYNQSVDTSSYYNADNPHSYNTGGKSYNGGKNYNGGKANSGGETNNACDDPYNYSEECIKSHVVKQNKKQSKVWSTIKSWWKTLGTAGQASFIVLCSLSPTLFIAILIARVRKQKRRLLKRLFYSNRRKSRRGQKPLMESSDIEYASNSPEHGLGNNDGTAVTSTKDSLKYDPPALRGSQSNSTFVNHPFERTSSHASKSIGGKGLGSSAVNDYADINYNPNSLTHDALVPHAIKCQRSTFATSNSVSSGQPRRQQTPLHDRNRPVSTLLEEEVKQPDQPNTATTTNSFINSSFSLKSTLARSFSSWFQRKNPNISVDQEGGMKVHPSSGNNSTRSQDKSKLQRNTSNVSNTITPLPTKTRVDNLLPSAATEENL